jgi:hypothetical protein
MFPKTAILFLTVIIGAIFVSCDKIESITQTDVDLEMTTATMSVDQPTAAFSSSDSVDLSTIQAYKDNKTRIKGLKIDQVLMTIHAQPGNAATMIQSASANVSNLDGSEETNLATLAMTSMAELDGVEKNLPLSEAGKQKLSELLLGSTNQAKVTFIGTADQGPVKFTVSFRIKMILTAGL